MTDEPTGPEGTTEPRAGGSPPRPSEGERRPRGDRLRDIARRLLAEREGEREPHVSLDSAREALASLLETGDRARTEVVRLLIREFRSYLAELGLKEELHHLLTNYSLEVRASVNLKPLAEHLEPEPEPPARPRRPRKKPEAPPPEEEG